MNWVLDHIEWIVGSLLAAASVTISKLIHVIWNDREGFHVRIKRIEELSKNHAFSIADLKRQMMESDSTSRAERKSVAAKLENHYSELRTDTKKLHDRITDLATSLARVAGAFEQMSRKQH